MNSKLKLIILYGFAASGKTTIATKYISDHPLSMMIEEDLLIDMVGQWRKFEDKARDLVYKHICSIVKNQLQAGYVVILPCLLTDATRAESFQRIAEEAGCPLYEVYLEGSKEVAITRLLKRGTWGEAGSPPLTDEDRPEIETLFETMEREMAKRKNVVPLTVTKGDVDTTYQKLLELTSD